MVRTSRCGRDNPGSTPGVVIVPAFAQHPNTVSERARALRARRLCHLMGEDPSECIWVFRTVGRTRSALWVARARSAALSGSLAHALQRAGPDALRRWMGGRGGGRIFQKALRPNGERAGLWKKMAGSSLAKVISATGMAQRSAEVWGLFSHTSNCSGRAMGSEHGPLQGDKAALPDGSACAGQGAQGRRVAPAQIGARQQKGAGGACTGSASCLRGVRRCSGMSRIHSREQC